MTFRQALWVSDGKSKLKSENEDTTHFENAIYRVLHESSSITAPFAENLEFPEKRLLLICSGSSVTKQNK